MAIGQHFEDHYAYPETTLLQDDDDDDNYNDKDCTSIVKVLLKYSWFDDEQQPWYNIGYQSIMGTATYHNMMLTIMRPYVVGPNTSDQNLHVGL